MEKFFLVRHGLKEHVPYDPPLTEVGIMQAESLAQKLKDIKFKAIICSPKLRTRQTAEVINKQLNIPIIFDPRLEERLEWQESETFEEFIDEWNKTDLNRAYRSKNGLSSNENGLRMKKLIDEISADYKGGNFLIVSHGGSIGDLLRHLFKEENIKHVTEPISKAKFIDLTECSVTIVEKEGDHFSLIKLNDVEHLTTPLT